MTLSGERAIASDLGTGCNRRSSSTVTCVKTYVRTVLDIVSDRDRARLPGVTL